MGSADLIAVGAAGGLVLVITVVDLFVTIFNYDGFTFLAARLHHITWRVVRHGAAPLRTGAYRALLDVETIIGLSTFTLALTYVLTSLDTLSNLNRLYGRVRRHAVEPNKPETILARYFHGGQPQEVGSVLQSLAEDLQAYDEGLRRYPVVFYFHTRRLQRSTPTVFDDLGDLIELLRWGLPVEQPLTSNPYLLALAAEYTTTVRRLQRSFVGPEDLALPRPADRHVMADATRGHAPNGHHARSSGSDTVGSGYVNEFARLRERASGAAGLPPASDDDAYERYLEWLPFHHRRSIFLHRLRDALGYG